MIGVLLNVLTVLLGSGIGLLFRKAIPKSVTDAAMAAIGLCTLYLGIT